VCLLYHTGQSNAERGARIAQIAPNFGQELKNASRRLADVNLDWPCIFIGATQANPDRTERGAHHSLEFLSMTSPAASGRGLGPLTAAQLAAKGRGNVYARDAREAA